MQQGVPSCRTRDRQDRLHLHALPPLPPTHPLLTCRCDKNQQVAFPFSLLEQQGMWSQVNEPDCNRKTGNRVSEMCHVVAPPQLPSPSVLSPSPDHQMTWQDPSAKTPRILSSCAAGKNFQKTFLLSSPRASLVPAWRRRGNAFALFSYLRSTAYYPGHDSLLINTHFIQHSERDRYMNLC